MRRGFGAAAKAARAAPSPVPETLLASVNRTREDIEKAKRWTASRRVEAYGEHAPEIAALHPAAPD